MISRLRDQLSDDRVVKACWCGIGDPQLVSTISGLPFDAVVLDGQHGYHTEHTMLNCIPHVVMAGKSPLVRIGRAQWDLCETALDFGTLGVIAPMINTAEDARAFARAAKFPKVGERSHGPRHAAALYGISPSEYLERANECTFTFAQIETKEAYDNLDAILEVDGIDGVLMGPSDFSIFVTGETIPDPYGEGTVELVGDIAKRAREAGKYAAAFTVNQDHANLVYGQGYRFISLGMDATLLTLGALRAMDGLSF